MAEKAAEGNQQVENRFDQSWREEQWGSRRLSVAAQEVAVDEKSMTTWQAIRSHPAAICWSLVISTCVIMEGYDTALLGNFWAYPSFQRKFGDFVGVSNTTRSGYQIPAAWQTGLGQASGVGAFFGAILNGWLATAYGPRKVLISALLALSAFLFITFFAPNRPVLLVGQLLCGFPWGIFTTTAPAYASEVLPLQLRVYFTSYTNMCWIIGQLIAGGVLRGLVTREDSWGYRIPFALQWLWPVLLVPAVYKAPESPWYLVRHNRLEEAEKSIRRLQSASTRQDPRNTLATIVYTNNLEEQLSVGTTYWDCFKGFELRRTEIACMVFGGQLVCGSVFAYASTYFFEQVGLTSQQAYSLGVGANGLALFACLCNWFILMPYFGRRPVYVWGMFAMAVELFLIGILNVWTDRGSVAWAQAILTLVWTVTFQLSAGQLGWALPAEVGSTRLRQKTVCLGRNTYYICAVIGGTLQNYMMNPSAWGLKGYTGFFWGGFATLVFVWAYFRLPETKGRTFHELDMLFAKQVSARKFATTNVDAFDEAEADQLATKYSVSGQPPPRPSLVPSITSRMADHGKAPDAAAQRRASLVAQQEHSSRRPSIAASVTEYLHKQ
jgi:SP family general alpha glucoside:H+ symporter-like MFS transporter